MKIKRAVLALTLPTMMFSAAPMVFAQDENQVLEEIVVTGIRGSLRAAADLKRNDSRIIDAIVAEDIGKLPDNNIAEALQRVTGISINREFGVGNEVSIRGLPQNRVEINGRTTLGDDRNGISFDDMPAAFLKSVEVIKSPTPEMIEGALGGTINMNTIRPSELTEQVMAGSIDMEYADKTENWAPILNGTYGNNWDLDSGGSFGVVASLSYQDRELRQDAFEQDLRVQDGFDINNDGVIDELDLAQNTPSGNYVFSREHKYEPFVENRERTAANITLEWAPSDRARIYLDSNFTKREGGEEAYSVLMAGGTPSNNNGQAFEDENGQLSNYLLEGAFILPKTWSEFRSTESFSHALGGEFFLTDKLSVSVEYSTAESDQTEPKSELNFRAHDQAAELLDPAAQNLYLNDAIIDVSSHDSVPGVDFLGDGDIYLNQDILALREFRHVTDDIFNSEDAFRVDFEFSNPGDLEWFTALKAGVRVTDREFEQSSAEMRYANLHQDLTSADGSEFIVITMEEFEQANPGTLVTPYSSGDLFDQAGYTSANATAPFTLYNAELLSGDLEGTFERIQALLDGTNMQIDGSFADNLEPNNSAYTLIEEETTALYLQADMDFEAARIVFGGRYVETDVTSSAFQDDVLVSDTETYSDFLPSINVSVDLTDDTILRVSGAKVMRRADFEDLSPAFDFDSDLATAERGNPGLEPFRATQFDFSLEHYFGDANMVSGALFYKDVGSFLKTSLYCAYLPDVVVNQGGAVGQFERACILPVGVQADSDVYLTTDDQAEYLDFVAQGRNGVTTETRTNGSNGSIQGFEIGTVYNFDQLPGAWSGLGVNANYTFAQSEDPNGLALEDISETSYNIQLFWENEDWSARLAWTSRDRFLDETQEKRTEHIGELVIGNDIDLEADPTQGNSFRDGIDQLDVSASWAVSDALTLVGSITNLTGEPIVNSSVTGTAWQVTESDRRFSLGARFTF